jgi:hypothetical protein
MSKKILVTDVDFVLLDWVVGLKPFFDEKGIQSDHLDQYRGSTYYPNLSELFFNDNEAENIKLMKEFNDSHWIEHLPIFQDDARKHLENISKKTDIYALTCLGDGQEQKMKRTQNLINHYGDIFKDVLCIPVRTSKAPTFKKLLETNDIHCYVDDRENHLAEAVSCNIDTLLFKRNENHAETESNVVNCWSEIDSYLDAKLENESSKKTKRKSRLRP